MALDLPLREGPPAADLLILSIRGAMGPARTDGTPEIYDRKLIFHVSWSTVD